MTAPLWTTGPPTPALGALRRAGSPQLLHHPAGHDPQEQKCRRRAVAK